jgi:hypothetical protein
MSQCGTPTGRTPSTPRLVGTSLVEVSSSVSCDLPDLYRRRMSAIDVRAHESAFAARLIGTSLVELIVGALLPSFSPNTIGSR